MKSPRLVALALTGLALCAGDSAAGYARSAGVEPGCYQLAIARGQTDIATDQAKCDQAYQAGQDDWCAHATSPSRIAVCRDPELRALALQRNKAYYDAQARLDPGASTRALFNDQTTWGESYALAYGITPKFALTFPLPPTVKKCMLRAGQSRLVYLQEYSEVMLSSPAASQPVAPTPSLPAALPSRGDETAMQECARYWHRQCVPAPSHADEEECVRYWYREQVNARPQSVENDCRDEDGVLHAKELSAMWQRRNETERRFKKEYADIERLFAEGYTAQAAGLMRDWNTRYQLWAASVSGEIEAAADRAQRILDDRACARGDRSKCRW